MPSFPSPKPMKFKPRDIARPSAKPISKPKDDDNSIFPPLMSTPVKSRGPPASSVTPKTPLSPSPVKEEVEPKKTQDLKVTKKVKKTEEKPVPFPFVYKLFFLVAFLVFAAPRVCRVGVLQLKLVEVGEEGRIYIGTDGPYKMISCRKNASFKLMDEVAKKCLSPGGKSGGFKSKRCGGATCWQLQDNVLSPRGKGKGEIEAHAALSIPALGNFPMPIHNFEEAWMAVSS